MQGAPRAKRLGLAADLLMVVKDYDQMKADCAAFFDTCRERPEHQGNVAYYIKRLNQGGATYEQLGHSLGGIPWMFIGVIHGMEFAFNLAASTILGFPLRGEFRIYAL